MNDNHHISAKLDELRPTLAPGERILLWQNIAPQIGAVVPSPYTRMRGKKGVVAVMMVLVTLTASGTVAAAQPARPGDVLFPVDQVSERALLLLTPEARREALKERFMEERFYELESLFDEAVVPSDDGILAWNSEDELAVAVNVFRDITVVKIELNDSTRYFTTSETSREVVAEAAAARYGLPYEAVLSVMEYEAENRESRPRDRGLLALDKQGDIVAAVTVVLDEMDSHDERKRAVFVSRFMEEYDLLVPFVTDDRVVRYRERNHDDSDDKYQVRFGDDRIEVDDDRIEIKSEALRIRYDGGSVEIKKDDDRDDDDSDSRDAGSSDSDDRADGRDDEADSNDDSDSRNEDRETGNKDEDSSKEDDNAGDQSDDFDNNDNNDKDDN